MIIKPGLIFDPASKLLNYKCRFNQRRSGENCHPEKLSEIIDEIVSVGIILLLKGSLTAIPFAVIENWFTLSAKWIAVECCYNPYGKVSYDLTWSHWDEIIWDELLEHEISSSWWSHKSSDSHVISSDLFADSHLRYLMILIK